MIAFIQDRSSQFGWLTPSRIHRWTGARTASPPGPVLMIAPTWVTRWQASRGAWPPPRHFFHSFIIMLIFFRCSIASGARVDESSLERHGARRHRRAAVSLIRLARRGLPDPFAIAILARPSGA